MTRIFKGQNQKAKKTNIPLRRKMAIFYARASLIFKILVIIFIYCFFFNSHFNFIKDKFISLFYEKSANYGLKLQNVVIEGQENLSSKKILEILGVKPGEPILKLDIALFRKKLMEDPWVKSVIIKRNLPNTLHIILYERHPIAIWQMDKQLFLIDEEGYKISCDFDDKFKGLVHVVGSEANIYADKLIKDIEQSQELARKLVSAVRYGQRRWDLNFLQDITVKFPENDFNKAYEYLIKLNNMNKLFDQNYKILDLRDPTKYYFEKYPLPK